MHKETVAYLLGRLLLALSAVLLLPILLAFAEPLPTFSFLAASLLTMLAGFFFLHQGRRRESLTIREGIAFTGLAWLLAGFFGMLPFVFGGYLLPLDAFFESLSGFTGLGATVFPTLTTVPQAILLWRSLTHWLGGLGIIVIFIALLPNTGQGAALMYNAEASGATSERVLPRLRDMARWLFRIYAIFTLLACTIFILCGMSPFEAINHAMSTVGTGGFSTYDDSAAHFQSTAVELSMAFFMFLSGGNYALYYRAWQKGWHVFRRNSEFKAYALMIFLATLAITLDLWLSLGESFGTSWRYAFFQVTSLATTGFASTNFDQWPSLSKGVLLLLMLIGGSAGSTAAGLKVSRVIMLLRMAKRMILRKLHPRQVVEVRLNGTKIDRGTLQRVALFFFLYMLFLTSFALFYMLAGLEPFDALGLSISALGCVGPAFGVAGPTENFAAFSAFTKSLLCIEMLLGRLEMFTLLAMLFPSFWKSRGNW